MFFAREHAAFGLAGQGGSKQIAPIAAHGCPLFYEIQARSNPAIDFRKIRPSSRRCFVAISRRFAGEFFVRFRFLVASRLGDLIAPKWRMSRGSISRRSAASLRPSDA